MPWKQQGGGGPWGGGGGQGPWGRGPSGPNQPPDFEELLRRGQDRFKSALPGGMGGGRGIVILIAVALVGWALSGFYRVQPDEQGVVLQFGKYIGTTNPGLNYHLPSPIQTVETPTVTRVNRIDVGLRTGPDGRGVARDVPEESLMLTGDENIVDIDFNVQWRIKDAKNYLFNVRDPESTVKVAAESAMREVIGRTPIQSALTEGRTAIESATRKGLQGMLDDYGAGISIERVQLLKVDPPQPVIDAFIDVQRARADLERLRNEAEAYRNDILPRARGAAERMIQEARAYKEQIINKAEGEAQRFSQVYQAYKVSKDVTARRIYLETLEQVFQGMNKIIIDKSAGQGVVPYLPLPELKKRAATTTPPKDQTGESK